MRLIDADALMERVWRDRLDSRELISSMVENAPTITDRPTGKWYKPKEFPKKSYRRICTVCQDVAYFCGEGNYRYCPNCGAKMEVRNDG